MPVIPTVRCRDIRRSLAFYLGVIGFTRVDTNGDVTDPGYCVLERDGGWLHLSSHSGDGKFGQAVVITTQDADAEWKTLIARGHVPPGRAGSPVHEGPLDQTWGTREFYVDDPDGNTLRFVQG